MDSLLDLLTSSSNNCSFCGRERPSHIEAAGRMIPVKYNTDLCAEHEEISRIKSIISSGSNKYVIFDGNIFRIGKPNSRLKGYGGKQFKVFMFSDKRVVKTDNLWFHMKLSWESNDTCMIDPNPVQQTQEEEVDDET